MNVALFFVLFYRAGLYSDTGLQLVYFALSAYGCYEWLHGGSGGTPLVVSRTTRRMGLALAGRGDPPPRSMARL